ncbi:hypothetical protein AURDEDRAFT_110675 [Auricularia subglabra TFB-10046 SS5]|nr:hypothetical protein AURDEDRAFT_110675 [Auricularia subglabra TFB-10046 SS5]
MENFTFPPKPRQQGQGTQQPLAAPRTMRRRSHSRSGSISAQISPPAQLDRPVSAPAPAAPPAPVQPPRSRPNSSHKRNSSVSNRRESAELMGIPLPPEDPATKDMDPVRRALLALEGKHSSSSPRNSFGNRVAKVQIPDFDAIEKSDLTEPRRPPLALNSSLAGKRDSFGKLLTPASSTKIELGTLLEEEEEEEDENIEPTPVVTTSSKPRPQTLDLRSLSVTTALTPPPNLPTPAATPSPRVAGLKSLTLASSPLMLGSPAPLSASRSATMSPPPARVLPIARKSSVSYKRSPDAETPRSPPPFQLAHKNVLLPSLLTPDPTPTTSSPPTTPNMSPSRRSFIYQSHSALVSRVSELERLLAAQSPTVQTPAPLTPANDEFLALIADLKAERDELKRDAQLHKSRIADLEKQSNTLMNRVEMERREAWVVREQLGVLEIEKAGLEKENATLNDTVGQLTSKVGQLEAEVEQARHEREEAQRELASMRERARPALKYVGSHNTGFSFQSIDSLGSATDVDDVASHRSSLATGLALKLKAVIEEEPDVCADLAQYDESVARYDDDSDDSFYSRSRTNSACSVTLSVDPPSRSPSPSPVSPSPAHGRHASLSHGWSFKAAAAAPRTDTGGKACIVNRSPMKDR